MIEGFYEHSSLIGLYLLLHNNSMDTVDIYYVRRNSISSISTIFKESAVWKRATLIMPFDHYPSLEELQQLPELFI